MQNIFNKNLWFLKINLDNMGFPSKGLDFMDTMIIFFSDFILNSEFQTKDCIIKGLQIRVKVLYRCEIHLKRNWKYDLSIKKILLWLKSSQ